MKPRKSGLALFWVGIVYMFGASWLAMWWVAPIWRNTPPEQFAGTIWAFAGPVFTIIAFSVPVGIVMTTIGMLLYSESDRIRAWPFSAFVAGAILVGLSMLFPATLGYYPTMFGIGGGLIYVFFFVALWYWAKNRRKLNGAIKIAADFQLASYVFFLLTASLICSLLGNPYSGLYFPAKVMQYNALPFYHSMGTKVLIYFTLGWLFSFLSQLMTYKHGRQFKINKAP